MRTNFILLCIFIGSIVNAKGQNDNLKKEQIQSIQRLTNIAKAKNKKRIAELIHYPLKRQFPLKDVKDKKDFIKRFDEIFDKVLLDKVAKSKLSDWTMVGWRGIMLDNGILWIDDKGKILTINYQSSKEKQLLLKSIQTDKNQLAKSLQNFEKPLYLILTKNYKIRIDQKAGNSYRYAAWKIKSPNVEPDIIIENGVLEFEGSGGNHTLTFENSGYTYTVFVNEVGAINTSEAILEVSKQAKIILTENGKIQRN